MGGDDAGGGARSERPPDIASPVGPWKVVQRNGQRTTKTTKGKSGISTLLATNVEGGADRGGMIRSTIVAAS